MYGEEEISIIKNKKYEEFGAYAYKQNHSNIKVNVTIDAKVDTSKAGKYTVTYTAGEGELQKVVTRTIIVEEVNQYYVITMTTFILGVSISVIIKLVILKKEKKSS